MDKEPIVAALGALLLGLSLHWGGGGNNAHPTPAPSPPGMQAAASPPAFGASSLVQAPSEFEPLPHLNAEAHCELLPFQGAHSSALIDEARLGAGEELVDACPSNHVMNASVTCESATNLENPDGEQRVRCVAQGQCRLCSADLARLKEASQ